MSYGALLATLDAWFARGRESAGAGVVPCRSGCSACCHGPFDVSPADAALLGEGFAQLPEPERAALAARAEAQLQRCAPLRPRWGPPWSVDALDEADFDALTEQLAHEPCPALDASGACVLHAHRPATCRMAGLPMGTPDGGRLENPCPIQGLFPRYAVLPPMPFELQAFEEAAERLDAAAVPAGHVSTTIAGAVVAAARRGITR